MDVEQEHNQGKSMGMIDTPFSYKYPLENSMNISEKVYDKETHINSSSNCYRGNEECSIATVFC